MSCFDQTSVPNHLPPGNLRPKPWGLLFTASAARTVEGPGHGGRLPPQEDIVLAMLSLWYSFTALLSVSLTPTPLSTNLLIHTAGTRGEMTNSHSVLVALSPGDSTFYFRTCLGPPVVPRFSSVSSRPPSYGTTLFSVLHGSLRSTWISKTVRLDRPWA